MYLSAKSARPMLGWVPMLAELPSPDPPDVQHAEDQMVPQPAHGALHLTY